jgi:hypothetical protein
MEPDPPPLRPHAPAHGGPAPLGPWIAHHTFGLLALVAGAIAFLVVALRQDQLWSSPDWRLTVPFFIGTLVLAVISIARRERAVILPLVGLALTAVAIVLGWFLVMAIIIAVTVVIIVILHAVM